MPHYRVHILDSHGELLSTVDVDCTDDEAAKERTEQVLAGHDGELWRRVALFQPDNLSLQVGRQQPPRRGRPRIRDHKQRTNSH